MPSYSKKVRVPGKTADDLYGVVSKELDRFLEKASIGKFDLERDPAAKEVRVKSSMFTGKLVCTNELLDLSGNLSLLATPFKSKLDDGIVRWLAKHFETTQSV